jgi:hypothetical protein
MLACEKTLLSKVSRKRRRAACGADAERSFSRVHTLLKRQQRRRPTIGIESEDVVETEEEDLAAFNALVQDGSIEVVAIEDGMPYYRIASEFAGPLEPTGPRALTRGPVLHSAAGGSIA